jgi:hypothetical protein
MYRPLVIVSLFCGLAQPADAVASDYAGPGRLAHAPWSRNSAPVPGAAEARAAAPLRPFLRLDGEAESGRLDGRAAGLEADGPDWRLKGEFTARPLETGIVPTVRLASSWRLNPRWQLSSHLDSLPLDEAPELGAERIRVAARRTGPAGAWDELSFQRRAATAGWSEDLALAAHRRLLDGGGERLSVTGRIVSRERAEAADRALSLSVDHRWEAWAHADLRVAQQLSVGIGGQRSESDLRATGRMRYGHLWELGDRLELEYAIERQNRPATAPEDDETRLSVGFTGTF